MANKEKQLKAQYEKILGKPLPYFETACFRFRSISTLHQFNWLALHHNTRGLTLRCERKPANSHDRLRQGVSEHRQGTADCRRRNGGNRDNTDTMKINKVHCFFEQSGTFKNEFIKLGIPAEDYDIQDNFGETDHKIDLFHEIEEGYNGRPSVFDTIVGGDLIFAFSPAYSSVLSRRC